MIKTMVNMEKKIKTIKFSTEIIKYFLVDYSDASILVTGNITVVDGDGNTSFAFKNCHPFTRSIAHLNDEHVGTAENLDLTMSCLHNLIEYCDNYADTTASLYQYKRPEQPKTDAGLGDVTTENSSSFKYHSSFLKEIESVNINADVNPDVPGAHRLWKNVKIAVPLKYISNFFRSLELPLINTRLFI